MALPELVHRAAEKAFARYCRERVFQGADGPVPITFEVEGDTVTLFAGRPIARFRYSQDLAQWSLHYPDGSGRWCFYLNAGPSLDVGKLLRHLDDDPTRTFWG